MNVMITGAGKGIGKAAALLFAKHGHHLMLCSRTIADLNDVKNEISFAAPGSKCFIMKCDVTDEQEVLKFCDEAKHVFGFIDVLINNAGTFFPGKLYEQSSNQFHEVMNTNLNSMFYFTKQIVPLMIEQATGHIINISSIAGLKSYPLGGAYSVSKFAVAGFSKNLRDELSPLGIKVTTIYPGAVLTESWKGSGLPDERFIPVEDVAQIIFNCTQMSKSTCVEEIIVRPTGGDIRDEDFV